MKNKRKGISLIVLVITIIVMMILATVVIITLSNNNVIIKGKEAVSKTNLASLKEEYQTKLANELQNNEEFKKEDVNATDSGKDKEDISYWIPSLKDSDDKNDFIILDGNIIYKGADADIRKSASSLGIYLGKPVTVQEIIANPENYYGKKVINYGETEQNWRIFYVDTDNYFGDGVNTIYLKADYTMSDSGYLGSYDSTKYTDDTIATTKMQALNPVWRDFKGTLTLGNEKFSAYLLDPVTAANYDTTELYWKPYFDVNNKKNINYVVSTPSIELYLKSYNDVHETSPILYRCIKQGGYEFSVDNGTTYKSYTASNTVDYTGFNSIYAGRDGKLESFNDYWCSWWIAGSTPYGANVTLQLDSESAYIGNWYNGDQGQFSPIVSLKSSFVVQIEYED